MQSNVWTQQLTLMPQNPVGLVTYETSTPSIGGSSTLYYWFVSHDGSGNASAPAGPFPTPFTTTPSASYPNKLTWTPPPGVVSVDILRLSTAGPPTGACGCAVATGVTSAIFSDTVSSTTAYTVATSLSQIPAILTNLNSGFAAPSSFGPNALSAVSFGVKADTKACVDATFTNLSQTITSAGQCQFTQADVGKIVFGTNMCIAGPSCGVLITPVNSNVVVPQGTITAVNSSTSITVSNAATANVAGFGFLVYGDDDTAALNALSTAIANSPFCPSVIFPSGLMLVQNGEFNSGNNTCANTPANETNNLGTMENRGIDFAGQGIGVTWLVPTPNFSFSTASCPTVGTIQACFFGNQLFASVHDLSIFGSGQSLSSGGPAALAFVWGEYSTFRNFGLTFWGAGDTSVTNYGINETTSNIRDCILWQAGHTNLHVVAGGNQGFLLGTWLGDSVGPAVVEDIGAYLFSEANFLIAPDASSQTIQDNGIYYSTQDTTLPSGFATPSVDFYQPGSSGVAYVTNFSSLANQASAKSIQISAGSIMYLSGSTLGRSGNGTAISNSGTLNDLGGNTYFGTISGTGITNDETGDKGLPAPTCSFTSGGGTSPSCTLPSGPTNRFGIVQLATGTGAPASSGTFTLTFGINSPTLFSCVLTPMKTSLTAAWQATATTTIGTVAANQIVVNWNNAGTALTVSSNYDVAYSCGQQ